MKHYKMSSVSADNTFHPMKWSCVFKVQAVTMTYFKSKLFTIIQCRIIDLQKIQKLVGKQNSRRNREKCS